MRQVNAIYVNNTLPLALVVHEISRHFWATYVNGCYLEFHAIFKQSNLQATEDSVYCLLMQVSGVWITSAR